jgi:hypothetical protein
LYISPAILILATSLKDDEVITLFRISYDGLSLKEVSQFIQPTNLNVKQLVLFGIEFAIGNQFLERKYDDDRYILAPYGREFINSQCG